MISDLHTLPEKGNRKYRNLEPTRIDLAQKRDKRLTHIAPKGKTYIYNFELNPKRSR